jgi:subtilisin family serine protease
MHRRCALRALLAPSVVLAGCGVQLPLAPATAAAVAGRLLVVYRSGVVPSDANAMLPGIHLQRLGMSIVNVAPGEEADAMRRLAARVDVAAVLQDRFVAGEPSMGAAPLAKNGTAADATWRSKTADLFPTADASYVSPAGWAVKSAGGYGLDLAGSDASGPWERSLGTGVRIAVLDSGIDAHHPDLAPNLAANLTEIDQTALPSPCDDGSPQDQQGHGTWAASLAAGALGMDTGEIVGMAPQATLLNIKVLERMPATNGATLQAQCEAGQTGGLLSWVLAGINDAIAQKADVISISLGTLVDLSTGDGAGWKASFDRATYAAQQAGVVIAAAAGNDGLDLSSGRYIELPAQARGVLAVTASTNPACAENATTGATCVAGPITRASYSNYGGEVLQAIAAPGGNDPEGRDDGVSGWIRGACSSGLPNTEDGLPANDASFGCLALGHAAYAQAKGSSASAPLVAGAAALLHAARPDWTAAQIVSALRSSATKLPSMEEPELNLPAALALP